MDGKCSSRESSESNESFSPLEKLLAKVNQSLKRLNTRDDIDLINADSYNDIKVVYNIWNYTSNTHTKKSVAMCMFQSKFVKIFKDIWLSVNQIHGDTMEQCQMIHTSLKLLCNTSDINSDICQDVCDNGVISMLLCALSAVSNNYSYNKQQCYVSSILTILHNVVYHIYDGRLLMRESDGVRILQLFLKTEIYYIRGTSLITLSYIVDETESELLNSNSDSLSFIIDEFDSALNSPKQRSKSGFRVTEILSGLSSLSASDVNKVLLVQNGVLPLYVRLLQVESNLFSEEEILMVVNGLWALSFSDRNKRLIQKEPGCLDALRRASTHGSAAICHAGKGTLWQLQSSNVNIPCFPGGSTLEAMALAVERSALILIGVSQRYKDSPNCRSECEYAYQLRKDIIPLMLQKAYKADGWLGMIMGAKLYFDFSSTSNFDAQIPCLIREIGTRDLKRA